jgi:hypothetical protein
MIAAWQAGGTAGAGGDLIGKGQHRRIACRSLPSLPAARGPDSRAGGEPASVFFRLAASYATQQARHNARSRLGMPAATRFVPTPYVWRDAFAAASYAAETGPHILNPPQVVRPYGLIEVHWLSLMPPDVAA